MYGRCLEFMPVLEGAARSRGARPGRFAAVPARATSASSRRPATSIVHNYGHGGSGFSFSYGCAHEVTATLKRDLATRDLSIAA